MKQRIPTTKYYLQQERIQGGAEGVMAPPDPVKISQNKAKFGHIDFMFLAPPLYPAAGSATAPVRIEPGTYDFKSEFWANLAFSSKSETFIQALLILGDSSKSKSEVEHEQKAV